MHDFFERELGFTQEKISCIGLGTMYFGSKLPLNNSYTLLDYYSEMGGSFLDSANKYASWVPGCKGGESETTIGNWMKMKKNRSGLFIASKVGFPYSDIPRSLKRDIIISECEKSLKRLRTDTIDLYFAHAYDDNTPLDELMEAFFLLKKTGKIRFAGASNFFGWQLSDANTVANQFGWDGFCCIQQRHTYLEPGVRADFGNQLLLTEDIKQLCQTKNISVMAYSSLLGGLYVKNNPEIPVQYQNRLNELRLKVLSEIAQNWNASPNAVVLAWMMQDNPPVIPIVSGSSIAQLQENFESLSIRLTNEQIKKLNDQFAESVSYS